MLNIEKICVDESVSIGTAIETLNETGRQMVLVVDPDLKLIGCFTDGDLRRAMLVGANLNSPITKYYNRNPLFGWSRDGRQGALSQMREHGIDQLPMLDDTRRVVGIESVNPGRFGVKLPHRVVIMSGGLGRRLRPLTDNMPKAMVPIGGKPILEVILERLIGQGFHNFAFAVNHMAHIIEEHFGDGGRWNVSIEYLKESKRMGTAGALSLLEHADDRPLLVTNCDVLTAANFQEILEGHIANGNALTVGAREFSYQVPYGVMNTKGGQLIGIQEKPEVSWLVNAGIYVLSPEILSTIPSNKYTDMTDVIDDLISKNLAVGVHAFHASWIDIGQPADLERAGKLNEF